MKKRNKHILILEVLSVVAVSFIAICLTYISTADKSKLFYSILEWIIFVRPWYSIVTYVFFSILIDAVIKKNKSKNVFRYKLFVIILYIIWYLFFFTFLLIPLRMALSEYEPIIRVIISFLLIVLMQLCPHNKEKPAILLAMLCIVFLVMGLPNTF